MSLIFCFDGMKPLMTKALKGLVRFKFEFNLSQFFICLLYLLT